MPGSDIVDLEPSTEYAANQAETNPQSSVSFVESDMRNIGLSGRSSSPAKRTRAERDADDTPDGQAHAMDLDVPDKTFHSPKKSVDRQHVSPMPSRFKALNGGSSLSTTTNSTPAQDQSLLSNGANSVSGSEGSTESHHEVDTSNVSTTMSTPATSTTETETETGNSDALPIPQEKRPSYDEQAQAVKDLISNQEPREGAKGFAISRTWLDRVQSRTTQGQHESFPKSAREGEIGPVDNSTIVRNDNFYNKLTDTNGQTFIPLKPGVQMNQDLEILPPEAWDLIVKWYGVAEESHVISRYMHNTSPPGSFMPNFQYELFPPILTLQKVRDETGGMSMASMKEKSLDAPSLVASRSEKYQSFLKRAKEAARIDMTVKVRVWRLLETAEARDRLSAMPTPVASRSASPAPQAALPKTVPKLLLDVNSLTSLIEDSDRERIGINDETSNDKYNGSVDLATIGFPESVTLILEEQVQNSAKEEYVSDSVKDVASQNGISINVTKSDAASTLDQSKLRPNIGSTRRSPTPSGIMTRGRANKKGKVRGCTGLVNLGNTCYMNSALQCIRSVEELTLYFLEQEWKQELNTDNPLGYHGQIAKTYASLLSSIYEASNVGSFPPRVFKTVLGKCQPLFSGYGQQDSQEFLSFLVDGLHEDLNRVLKKPYMENPESDDKTVHDPNAIKALGEKFRSNYRARNDSVAMDLFNGFYKNTMVCPVCSKVSITFDPYSLLTLQLPIESTFQHNVLFNPLRGAPVQIRVDTDKNSNVRMLKEYVGKRVNCKAERMVLAETYNNKFYKLFEDAEVLSEANIATSDWLVMHELEEAPTNWPPLDRKVKPRTSLFAPFSNNSSEDDLPNMESKHADRMAIPIIHRTKMAAKQVNVSWPSFILITREEAKDFDCILRKVLQKVDTMTTRNLAEEDTASESRLKEVAQTESDTVVMTDEDESSSEKIQARSVESDEDLVDISMADEAAESLPNSTPMDEAYKRLAPRSKTSRFVDPSFFIRPGLRNLFSMCYFGSGADIIPTGWSSINDSSGTLPTLESRIPRSFSRRTSTSSRHGEGLDSQRSDSSEDELARDDYQELAEQPVSQESDSDDEAIPPSIPRSRLKAGFGGKIKTYSRKTQRGSSNPVARDDYLIRLGEGIVLDWDPESFEALFEGEAGDEFRGQRTDVNIPIVADPDLEEKKAKRAARKKSGVSLDECFDETAKTEILSEENAWYCGRCKELRRASKTLEIWTVPDILVLHLKRFSANSRLRDKVDVLVDFPTEGLDLAGRVGLPEDKSLTYDLFAVDNHYGGLGGGHYTAYAQNFFDKKWYEYNDQSVSGSSAAASVTRAAYLLFYRRRSDKSLGPPYLHEIVNKSYGPDSELTLGEHRNDGSMSPQENSGRSLTTATEPLELGGQEVGIGSTRSRGFGGGSRSAMNEAPPAYDGAQSFDEGIDMDDPDNPLPSFETDHGHFIGPALPHWEQPSWSFDKIAQGTAAPPGSDNGMEDGDSDTLADNGSNEPGVGDEAEDRMLEDFGDESLPPFGRVANHQRNTPEYDEKDVGVLRQVVPLGDDGDNDSDVAEVRVSDEEGGP